MKEIKFRNLTKDEVEVRVGGGGSLLLYKTARVDSEVLDATVSQGNWQKKFYQVKNTMICSVGININYDEPNKEPVWVWKDDAGDDDYTMEKVKAEASDSFKRACFAWGIGRCLYYGPKMRLPDNLKARAADKNNPLFLDVSELEYDKNGRISKITITTDWGKTVVYQWENGRKINTYPTTTKEPKKGTVEEITKGIADTFVVDDDGVMCSAETKKKITDITGKYDADKYNRFKNYIQSTFGVQSIAELTELQGQQLIKALGGK